MNVRPDKRPTDLFNVSGDAPLRLSLAAELAFPGGGMTAAGLRKEAAKGKLAIERIAGKDYTTLAAIQQMRTLCRIHPKVPGSGFGPVEELKNRLGLSGTDQSKFALDAALASAKLLRKCLPNTFPKNIALSVNATAIQAQSR
jgi:hypothetical protein